jgi:hypothetical protein
MNSVRIRTDLKLVKLYSWPNPRPPEPLKPRSQAAIDENRRLEADRRAWVNRAIWAGL